MDIEEIKRRETAILALNLPPFAALRLHDTPVDKFEAAVAEVQEFKALGQIMAKGGPGEQYDIEAFTNACLDYGMPLAEFRAELIKLGAECDVHTSTSRPAPTRDVYADRVAQIDAHNARRS